MLTNPTADTRPQINTEKVCVVVSKAREHFAEDEGVSTDASNPSDDQSLSILTDNAYSTIKLELVEFISGLDVDETYELVALTWLGRGDFEITEWSLALDSARERQGKPAFLYLLDIPLLPDYLEIGLDYFGESCSDCKP